MQKQAFKLSPKAKDWLVPALAGVGGGAAGYGASPYMFGYEDNPVGRRVSAMEDAALAAALAALYRKKMITPKQVALGGVSGYAISQAVAKGHAMQDIAKQTLKSQERLQQQQEQTQTKDIAQREVERNAPTAFQAFTRSPTTRGAGIGAAGAGLAAILTGLARKRTEEEMKNRTSRMGMIGSDTLKYILPAMIAGGVAGSFTGK